MKLTQVNGNTNHNLVNVGILDTVHAVLEGLDFPTNRAGLDELHTKLMELRNEVFQAKMDYRRAMNL